MYTAMNLRDHAYKLQRSLRHREYRKTIARELTRSLMRALAFYAYVEADNRQKEDRLVALTGVPTSTLRKSLLTLHGTGVWPLPTPYPAQTFVEGAVDELLTALLTVDTDVHADSPVLTSNVLAKMPIWKSVLTSVTGASTVNSRDSRILWNSDLTHSCVAFDCQLGDKNQKVVGTLVSSQSFSAWKETSQYRATVLVPNTITSDLVSIEKTYTAETCPDSKDELVSGIEYYVPWIDELLWLYHCAPRIIVVPQEE